MIAGTDLFTEVLRYVVWSILALLVLGVFGAVVGTVFMQWWHRVQLKRRHRVYDWMIDGGPVETEDMYPRTHVHIPDSVPDEWNEAWW